MRFFSECKTSSQTSQRLVTKTKGNMDTQHNPKQSDKPAGPGQQGGHDQDRERQERERQHREHEKGGGAGQHGGGQHEGGSQQGGR
jgi:hypothetical protein